VGCRGSPLVALDHSGSLWITLDHSDLKMEIALVGTAKKTLQQEILLSAKKKQVHLTPEVIVFSFCRLQPPMHMKRPRTCLPHEKMEIEKVTPLLFASLEFLLKVSVDAGAAIGHDFITTMKGSASIALAFQKMPHLAYLAEEIRPADIDLAIAYRYSDKAVSASVLLEAARRVAARIEPLFDSTEVHRLLETKGCKPDFLRSSVGDQAVSLVDRTKRMDALPIIAWLHPNVIDGYKGERVWLARVGIPVMFKKKRCLVAFIDLVAVEVHGAHRHRREQGEFEVEGGVMARRLEFSAQEHVRMLFKETAGRPWLTKNFSARTHRCTLMCAAILLKDFGDDCEGEATEILQSLRYWLSQVVDNELTRQPNQGADDEVMMPFFSDNKGWHSCALRKMIQGLYSSMKRITYANDKERDEYLWALIEVENVIAGFISSILLSRERG
jgi:hypothetical protein